MADQHAGSDAGPDQRTPDDAPYTLSDVPGAADRPAEERGSLDLRTRALAHIAEHAAAEVAGTVRSGSTVRRTLGRAYPRASARLDAGRASLDLDIAVTWPSPVAEVLTRTRDHVLDRTGSLGGIEVSRVDVTVHVVTETDEPAAETRRVE